MTVTAREQRELAEQITRRLMSKLGDDLKFLKENGYGVTILAFPFEVGAIAYISTAQRAEMVKALTEFLAMLEAGLTTEPLGERGQS